MKNMKKYLKTFLRKYKKWGPGSVLGRVGLQIRILREKLRRMMGSDLFFINFWKFGYLAIWLSGILSSNFHKIDIWAHNYPPKVGSGGCGLKS